MTLRPVRRVRDWLARRWARDESDFSVPLALDPLISNRAILVYFVPLPLIGFIGTVVPSGHWKMALGAVAAWYVCGFLLFVSRAVVWNVRAKAQSDAKVRFAASTARLANALADVHRANPDYFELLDWTEHIQARQSGDSTVTRTVRVRVGPEPLNVIWSGLESHGPPVNPDRVKLRVRQVLDDDHDVRLDFDVAWFKEADRQKCQVHVHTTRVMEPGEEFVIRIVWTWPRYLQFVTTDRRAETFCYKLTRACAQFRFELLIPRRAVLGLNAHPVSSCSLEPPQTVRSDYHAVVGTGNLLKAGDAPAVQVQALARGIAR